MHAKKTAWSTVLGHLYPSRIYEGFLVIFTKILDAISPFTKTQHVLIPTSLRRESKSQKFQESFLTNNDQVWRGKCKQKKNIFRKIHRKLKKPRQSGMIKTVI